MLRAKVEDLQQIVNKYQPIAHKDGELRLRFSKGVNKSVILSLVDELLSNKAVNIWWLPDNIERIFYYNIISLLLSVLDEILDGMNLSFAGHNLKLQLTYLDVEATEAASRGATRTPMLQITSATAASGAS